MSLSTIPSLNERRPGIGTRWSTQMADAPHSEVAAWFAPAVAAVSAALGAFGIWLANRMLGKAAFQTAINTGFKELTDQLQEERAAMRQELTEERVKSAAVEAQLRGEIINLTQVIEGLKDILRKNGIPVPSKHKEPADFVIIPGAKPPHDD